MDSMTIEIKLALLAFCVLMFFAIGMIVGYVIGWEKQKGEMDAIARTLEGGREMSDDLINRQAAIRWVKTECNPYGKPTLDFKSGVKVIEHLKQMPSAGSEKHTGNARKTHACDWISRQSAIDALAKMMPRSYTPDGSHPADEEIFKVQELYADCIKTLEILPSAEPEQRWISCSERLPKDGLYIVTTRKGQVQVLFEIPCEW